MASLRLVSKSWREAVKRCPWTAQCRIRDGSTLEGVCKILPSLTFLHLSCKQLGTIKLEPLRRHSALTGLQVTGEVLMTTDGQIVEPLLELSYLPSQLKSLTVAACFADTAAFTKINCPQLTRMEILSSQTKGYQIAELLSHLPALKVQQYLSYLLLKRSGQL